MVRPVNRSSSPDPMERLDPVEVRIRPAPQDSRAHVLHLTFGMGIGGMERVIMDLCRYVDPDRYRFSICCLFIRGPLADEIESEGIPVHYCRNQSRIARHLRSLELARLFPRMDIQVLHTHHTSAFVDGAIAGRLARIPVIINTDHSQAYPIPHRWSLLQRGASMIVDEVIAVSEDTRRDLIRHLKISPKKLSVIHNGIQLKGRTGRAPEDIRRELGIPAEAKVVGAVARLETQKGLDLLLDAAPLVQAVAPETWFLFVGGGTKESWLKERAASLGLDHRVVFTGWRRDAIDLLSTFDCYASSSNFEGMPMSMLEAMASAKPIVATAVGGCPDLVQDSENGFLVHSRDPRELADALLRVVGPSGDARRLGDRSRRLYERHFTAEAMARAYADLYGKHLARKGIRP